MTKTLGAIFEDGVLKPLEDPGLIEHELVELEIKRKSVARSGRRVFGGGKGLIKRIADDFDDPLEDFREYM